MCYVHLMVKVQEKNDVRVRVNMTLDPLIHEKACALAAKRRLSLSRLVEQLLSSEVAWEMAEDD